MSKLVKKASQIKQKTNKVYLKMKILNKRDTLNRLLIKLRMKKMIFKKMNLKILLKNSFTLNKANDRIFKSNKT